MSLSIYLNPGCRNGPKFLETCFEVPETSFDVTTVTNSPKMVTKSPKTVTRPLKIVTNILNLLLQLAHRSTQRFRFADLVSKVLLQSTVSERSIQIARVEFVASVFCSQGFRPLCFVQRAFSLQ